MLKTRAGLAVTLLLVSLPAVIRADQFNMASRFRAAHLVLQELVDSLSQFDYPQLDTSSFPELISPYRDFLQGMEQALRNSDKLDNAQQGALSFFCSAGISNIKNLLMNIPNALLVPRQPGDTPDKLRKRHALAFEFFEEQSHLAELIAPLAGCSQLGPLSN